MENEKKKSLNDVHNALEVIEEARAMPDISSKEKEELENASIQLRKLERSIIRVNSNNVLTTVKTDAEALKIIVSEIKRSTEKLAHTAAIIEKAAKTCETLVKVISAAVSGGIL